MENGDIMANGAFTSKEQMLHFHIFHDISKVSKKSYYGVKV